MKIIYNNTIPVKGFVAMMLFGVIFARKIYKHLTWMVINHEYIHKAQAKDCRGYVPYYCLYICQCIKYGYADAPFEKEAKRYALWGEYLQNRPYKNWRQFKR